MVGILDQGSFWVIAEIATHALTVEEIRVGIDPIPRTFLHVGAVATDTGATAAHHGSLWAQGTVTEGDQQELPR